MSRHDTMRDPRFAGILHAIESQLHATDRLVAARGLALTDSNVRSLLIRASNEAREKSAKADRPPPRKKIVSSSTRNAN